MAEDQAARGRKRRREEEDKEEEGGKEGKEGSAAQGPSLPRLALALEQQADLLLDTVLQAVVGADRVTPFLPSEVGVEWLRRQTERERRLLLLAQGRAEGRGSPQEGEGGEAPLRALEGAIFAREEEHETRRRLLARYTPSPLSL